MNRSGRRLDRYESALARVLHRAGLGTVRPIVTALESAPPTDVQTRARFLRAMLAELDQRADQPPPELAADLRVVIEELARLGMVDMSEDLATALRGVSGGPADYLLDPQRIAVADARLYHRASERLAPESLRAVIDPVRESIVRGLERQLSDAEIADEIRRAQAGLSRSRARAWATTETTRYYNLGRLRVAEEAGDFVWGYRYEAIVDARTTDVCRGFAGRVVAKGDMEHVPPFHWNCRTTLVPVMAAGFGGPDDPRSADLSDAAGGIEDEFGSDPRELLLEVA